MRDKFEPKVEHRCLPKFPSISDLIVFMQLHLLLDRKGFAQNQSNTSQVIYSNGVQLFLFKYLENRKTSG
jgi:hypothetical protein